MNKQTPIKSISRTLNNVKKQLDNNCATSTIPVGQTNAQQHSAQPKIEHNTVVLINMLFARFQHIYTHKFESAYADTQTANMAKKEWALSLSGFTQQQMEYAIEQCKDQFSWPPSICEFKALMLSESSPQGLPNVRNAYVEACRGADHPSRFQWSHQLVYLAAKQTDFFLLRSEIESRVFPIFERHYQQLCLRWQAGEEIDIPQVPALASQVSALDGLALLAQLNSQYDQYPAEKISQLFYYVLKPSGSSVRAHFRQQSILKAQSLGWSVDFPD